MEMKQANEPILIIDENRGIYAAQAMFKHLRSTHKGQIEWLPYWAYKALEQGPDNEYYEEAANEMDEMTFTIDGVKYNPYQDGDYWLVPTNYEWPEEWQGQKRMNEK